jgi:hypothetical protein
MHPYLAQKIAAQRGTELRKQAAVWCLAHDGPLGVRSGT